MARLPRNEVAQPVKTLKVHELSQIVEESAMPLYAQIRYGAAAVNRTDPVGLLRGIGVQKSKDTRLVRPYLLLENVEQNIIGASSPTIVDAVLYQEVNPFVEVQSS